MANCAANDGTCAGSRRDSRSKPSRVNKTNENWKGCGGRVRDSGKSGLNDEALKFSGTTHSSACLPRILHVV